MAVVVVVVVAVVDAAVVVEAVVVAAAVVVVAVAAVAADVGVKCRPTSEKLSSNIVDVSTPFSVASELEWYRL